MKSWTALSLSFGILSQQFVTSHAGLLSRCQVTNVQEEERRRNNSTISVGISKTFEGEDPVQYRTGNFKLHSAFVIFSNKWLLHL
jgi:hypothetical protein